LTTLWRGLRVVVFAIPFTFFMVNFHEIGHTIIARALGDTSAHYVLFQSTATSTCAGCNLYDSARLDDVANIVVNFGGVLFTQFLCWAAILLMAFTDRRILPSWMLWTAAAIAWLGDLVFQLLQGLYAGVPVNLPRGPEMSYTDYTAIVWFARDATGISTPIWKLLLLLGTIAYSAILVAGMLRAVRRRSGPILARRSI
jgi:hypothetical protein